MVTPDIMVCNIHLLISIVHSTLCNHPTAGWGFPNCIQAMQGNAMQLHSSYRNCHRAVLLCFSHCHSSNYSENFEVAWSHQKWRCLVMMACSSLLCQFFLSLLAMCHIHSGMICSWATPCQYGKATWICRGTCISSYIQGSFAPAPFTKLPNQMQSPGSGWMLVPHWAIQPSLIARCVLPRHANTAKLHRYAGVPAYHPTFRDDLFLSSYMDMQGYMHIILHSRMICSCSYYKVTQSGVGVTWILVPC